MKKLGHKLGNLEHIRIQEAARLLGVSTKTLRRWEDKGKLIAKRSKGNQRFYTLDQVNRQIDIMKLNKTVTKDTSISQTMSPVKNKPNIKRVFAFAFIFSFLVSFGVYRFNDLNKEIISKKETLENTNNPKVLAAETGLTNTISNGYTFNINVPSQFNDVVTFEKDITAPNVVTSVNGRGGDVTLSLTAGSGITVDGLKVTNSGITSLTAGSGISVSGSTITNSDLGSSQNIFKTVAVTGQTSVASDANSDTLTFVGSGGLSITTDANLDTVTFTAEEPDYTLSGWTDGGTDIYLTSLTDEVGIGTITPSYKLHVVGTGYFSDTLTLGGALAAGGLTNLNGNTVIGNEITDTVTFTGRIANGTSLLPISDLGANLGSSDLRFNNLWVANINSNSSQAFSGQTTFSFAPTDTTLTTASVLINPASSVANGQLLAFGIAGYERASIDEDGDIILGYSDATSAPVTDYPLTVYGHSGTIVGYIDTTGLLNLSGNLDVNGTTNDIAGTLNLSGNALTSSGALTITPTAGNNLNIVTSSTGDVVVNTNQFVVDASDAKVGIGTAAPTSKLHVTGAVTGKALTILDETGDQDILTASASGVSKFTISHSGYVGIGTTSPTVKLDIAAVSGTDALRFTSSGSKVLGLSVGTSTATFDIPTTDPTNKLTNGTFETDVTTGGWSGTQSYTLNDQFTTDRAAGAVNGTSAEPTGGTRTVSDTNSKISIANGVLDLAAGAANPSYIAYPAIVRSIGLVFSTKINITTGYVYHGLSTSAAASPVQFYFENGSIYFDGSFIVGSYTANTDYYIASIARSAGNYYYIKGGTQYPYWTLLWSTSTGTQTYPKTHSISTSTDLTIDNYHIPTATFTPTPLAYDTFTRGDGAIGTSETTGPDSQTTPSLSWTGGAISSNTNIITPTLGSDLITNGGFDSDTVWTKGAGWTIADGVATHASGVGSGVVYQALLTTGVWYQMVWDVTAFTSSSINAYFGTDATTLRTAAATYTDTGRATGANVGVRGTAGGAGSVDNISVKSLTLSSLFSTVPTSDKDIVASTDIVATAGTQAGIVTNLDNATTPTAGVVAYLTRGATDATSKVTLDKFTTATTWTNLTSGTVTYSAGATLRVVTYHSDASTLKVRVYYNNAFVGAEATVTDTSIISNTIHGLFSTYSGNTFDNFTLFPRGSDGEYNELPAEDLTVTKDTGVTFMGSSGSAKLVAGGNDANFLQSANVGDTNTYTLNAYVYTDGSAVTSSDLELYYDTDTITTTYYAVGAGWFRLRGTLTGVASAKNYGVRVKAGKTVYVDNITLTDGTAGASTMYVYDSGGAKSNLNVQGLIDGTLNGVATYSKAGTISDTDFTTASNGLLGVDTTNHRLYFREGGSWSYIARTAGFQIPKEETAGLTVGDYLLPYVESVLSDGALHGMYKKFEMDKNPTFSGLSVLGSSTLGDTSISKLLNIGKITIDESGINSSDILRFQSLELSDIEFVGGKIKLTKEGLIIGNENMRGNEKIPSSINNMRVTKNWIIPPEVVFLTASFDTESWVSNIDSTGFTINLSNTSEKEQEVGWIAVW